MKIRENLGSFVATQGRSASTPPTKKQVGKVFGVITTENTPTKALFENNGGWSGIGTIFYMDYDQVKNVDTTIDLSKCRIAKPFYSHIKDYPLIGELVEIIDAPSPASQVGNSVSQKYYSGVINLWNNNQQNAPSGDTLGSTFVESDNTKNLLSFEGDRIYQGRKGNSIRFGSTVSAHSDINEWSSIGNNGDPIMILSNGYSVDSGSLSPSVEQINKDLSSIYLTSTQLIPLQPDRTDSLNPLTKPLLPKKYTQPQLILNSGRITLNSTRDEVMIFAKTNVEINTNNIVNLNAGNYIHLNSPHVNLGTNSDGTAPTEPLLLGGKTHDLLLKVCDTLSNLASYLTSATSTEAGSPLPSINDAGTQLFNDIDNIIDLLDGIQSTQNFTA
jgi:hypothetical protein